MGARESPGGIAPRKNPAIPQLAHHALAVPLSRNLADNDDTMPVIDVYFFFARRSLVSRRSVGGCVESWVRFLTIYAPLLADLWAECIMKEFGYTLNRRYSTRTNSL